MTTLSKSHAIIVEHISPYSQNYNDWVFCNKCVPDTAHILNTSRNHCLCGHRANNLYAYMFDTHYILLGKSCAKKHFKIDAVAKNEINQREFKPDRYCIVCEKHIRSGIHNIKDQHYTCYIKNTLLPRIDSLICKHENNNMTGYVRALKDLKDKLMIKLEPTGCPSGKKYNTKAVIKETNDEQVKQYNQISNQDLEKIGSDLLLMDVGEVPIISEFMASCIIEREADALQYTLLYGKHEGKTLKTMISSMDTARYLFWLKANTKSENLKQHITIVINMVKKKPIVV